ncbi:MAG: serine/threonine protein kinase [Chloroflexi bacterium]|nr:serine/threonine protein kinase [Chloroflexota bacterium]MCC6894347.1 serine/threonine protein kinase [Anaerolineae bacterium]
MSDLVGQTLGQYQVTAQIGKGGMSTVYQAIQTSMKRTVAIKVLPRTLTHEDKFLERFYREVEIVSSLQHPHILPVYDFGEYDGMPYIVMAYMSSGTLSDLIAKGAIAPNETLRLVKQMAEALDYAHRKGVIHRDFKPGNVLLDEQNNTYLTDFGLAKISESTEQLTGTGILGTPFYMAPEQAEPGALTPAADVYAMGITVFQMLAGHVPFEAATPLGVLMAHMTQPIPNIRHTKPELPEDIQDVIDRSMSKSPQTRYPSAGALASALEYALAESHASVLPLVSTQPSETTQALLMTNTLGQVIFVDQPCLRLLKRHHNEARTIIGKGVHEVLGVEKQVTDQFIQQVGKRGRVGEERLDIKDAFGTSISVMWSATATQDDKNAFVGADITLKPIQDVIVNTNDFDTVDKRVDTTDEGFMQVYFVKQMQALRESMVQLGGKRLGANLDKIINETAQRNVWPMTMNDGQIHVELQSNNPDVYRALLSKGIAYAVGLVGKKMVIRSMQTVDKQVDPTILRVADQLKIYDLFDVL